MRKAFTIIELLTITAIICLLASIAIPLLVAGKTESVSAQAVRHARALATATRLYMNDTDEHFPLAAVVRPDGNHLLGTNLLFPFPASSCHLDVFDFWNTPERENMAHCFWANAIFSYVNDVTAFSIPGLQTHVMSFDHPDRGPVFDSTQLMNGDLHRYPLSSVENPGFVPLYWTGHGALTLRGRGASSPDLDCGGSIDDCMFNPHGQASASGNRLFQDPGRADIFGQVGDNIPLTSNWIFDKQMPMSTVDTSATLAPVGNVIYPNVANSGTAIAFPFSQLDTDGSTGPDPFNAAGTRYQFWTCNVNGVVTATPDNSNMTYWCFFRPDRNLGLRRGARP